MTPFALLDLFERLHWMDRDELEKAGVFSRGEAGDKDWISFNKSLTSFVLKLPADRLAAFAALVAKEKA